MSQSESKPVYYLKLINAFNGEYIIEKYYTLLEFLTEIQHTKSKYPLVLTEATVLPANKQSWLDDILTRDNLK